MLLSFVVCPVHAHLTYHKYHRLIISGLAQWHPDWSLSAASLRPLVYCGGLAGPECGDRARPVRPQTGALQIPVTQWMVRIKAAHSRASLCRRSWETAGLLDDRWGRMPLRDRILSLTACWWQSNVMMLSLRVKVCSPADRADMTPHITEGTRGGSASNAFRTELIILCLFEGGDAQV